MTNYRCWEEMNSSESFANKIEADSPEEAAEEYAEALEDLADYDRGRIVVNVSADDVPFLSALPPVRFYWTVEVSIDWSPSFHADAAVRREDSP
jgi:hypothetical protein